MAERCRAGQALSSPTASAPIVIERVVVGRAQRAPRGVRGRVRQLLAGVALQRRRQRGIVQRLQRLVQPEGAPRRLHLRLDARARGAAALRDLGQVARARRRE